MSGLLEGCIALVTGASRGAGKGVAIGLAEAGATIVVTARTRTSEAGEWPGSLDETLEQIARAGGQGIGIECDHSDDKAVEGVFDRVARDYRGLDVLVNNVFGAPSLMPVNLPFWETPVAVWDLLHTVGLRSHFVASQFAIPLMLGRKNGLVVNTSSPAGGSYTFNVPFGVQKSGVDRLALDMAHELKPYGIAAVSIWPGFLKSEKLAAQPDRVPPHLAKMIAENGETALFAGRAIAALAKDPHVMRKTGKILRVSELAVEYGFTDVDGNIPTGIPSWSEPSSIRA